jgi:putative phosphoesterase
MKIGLISDTHGHLDPQVFKFFADCDEIWHGGDIGTLDLADQLADFKPFRAVYGNIDGTDIRTEYPENLLFEIEGHKIFMTHIGGYPPRYNKRVKAIIKSEKPALYICGHSHIVKVMHDPEIKGVLHINPGAAGIVGFHRERTLITLKIEEQGFSELQLVKLGKRG